jgi:hypothetical protein
VHKLSTSFILGYHGCSAATAEKLLSGVPFKPSANAYDWLGDGVYFWESNPQRGLEFYRETQARKNRPTNDAAVVGAVVELGYCLDLSTSTGIGAVKAAYENMAARLKKLGEPLPQNRLGKDKVLRQLDRNVFNYLHAFRDVEELEPFDTVRGFFTEGDPAFPGAGFMEKTHVQIAVRELACIKGVFRVPLADLSPA